MRKVLFLLLLRGVENLTPNLVRPIGSAITDGFSSVCQITPGVRHLSATFRHRKWKAQLHLDRRLELDGNPAGALRGSGRLAILPPPSIGAA